MRIVRYKHNEEAARFGWIFNDKVGLIEGSPFEEFRRGGRDPYIGSAVAYPNYPQQDHLCGP